MPKQLTDISSATISRATIMQAITSCKDPVDKYQIANILLPPEGYPIDQILNNCKKNGLLDSTKKMNENNRKANCFFATELGREYLDKNHENIQQYGEYVIVPKGTTPVRKPKLQATLPLQQIPKFSTAVQSAMRELEQVATINEQARNCIDQLRKITDNFALLNTDTSHNLHGALDDIQTDTIACVEAIEGIDSLLEQLGA